MNEKVFCIGVNKTGTNSLHQALQILGYTSVHYLDYQGDNIKAKIEQNYLDGCNILKGLEQYDAISDWDYPTHAIGIIKAFDIQYPGSKFILTTRDRESWISSRKNHVVNNQIEKAKNPNNPEPGLEWQEYDVEAWKKEYDERHREVLNHFKNREKDLLVFNVVQGDGWEKLCPFLDSPIPKVAFPKINTTHLMHKMKARLRSTFTYFFGN